MSWKGFWNFDSRKKSARRAGLKPKTPMQLLLEDIRARLDEAERLAGRIAEKRAELQAALDTENLEKALAAAAEIQELARRLAAVHLPASLSRMDEEGRTYFQNVLEEVRRRVSRCSQQAGLCLEALGPA